MTIGEILDELNKFRKEFDTTPTTISVSQEEYDLLIKHLIEANLVSVDTDRIDYIAGIKIKIMS